jgi:hypothetical protein
MACLRGDAGRFVIRWLGSWGCQCQRRWVLALQADRVMDKLWEVAQIRMRKFCSKYIFASRDRQAGRAYEWDNWTRVSASFWTEYATVTATCEQL